MDITHITSLLGGIALFLYGMSIMGAGLEKLAGGKMQGVLQKLTSSTLKGVIFGTLITGVIQSSAGTVVICVGLVNSGIMTLTQSVGVIMGANIGTTVTGQLIRMADISGDSLWLTLIQPKTFAPVVAFIGCIFYVFLRSAKRKNIGQIMLGFGILFTGMSLMDTGVAPLRESAVFQNLFVTMTNPVLGILVGVVVTVIIQSSSASVGILQALSSTGLVTFSSAIPIILGAHIGTAFTPLLTIGGSSKDGKRAALIHLYFNIIGSVILLALVYAVQFAVGIPMWNDVMNKSSIANIHTFSSVCAMLLFLPCSGVLSKLAMLTVPDNAEEAQELSMPVLDERLFKSPAVALQQAKSAVVKMSRRAARNVNLAAPLLLKMDEDAVSAIRVRENLIDRMEAVSYTHLDVYKRQGIPIDSIPMNDPKVYSLLTSPEALGVTPEQIDSQTGTFGIPEMGTNFVRGMLVEARPKNFSELIQISGLSHGTDVWTGNADELIRSGTCTIAEVIGCRDSIMLYLLRKGLEPKMAFDIMEAVRKGKVAKGGFKDGWEEAMREHDVPDWYIESCRKIKYMFPKAHAVAYLMSAIRLMWFKIYKPQAFYAVYFTVRGDDIDYEAAIGGAAVARAHMEEVKRRLKEEKNAKDEDVLVSLQLVNEMLVRGYEFLPIELGKSRGSKYVVEDGKVRLPFSSLKGLGGAAADALERVTIHGEEYLSVEELQQASGVGQGILDRLRQVGALGDLPESSQVSFF